MIQRSFINIFSDHLTDTRDFYMGLFGYEVAFEVSSECTPDPEWLATL